MGHDGKGAMKALVADDDSDNREILVRMLTHAGWEAEAVDGGADAVVRILGGGYDAALLDLAMPGIDGLEAARRVRAGGSRIPLIAVSGAEAEARARENGFDRCLEKPYTLEDLRGVLRDIVRPEDPET